MLKFFKNIRAFLERLTLKIPWKLCLVTCLLGFGFSFMKQQIFRQSELYQTGELIRIHTSPIPKINGRDNTASVNSGKLILRMDGKTLTYNLKFHKELEAKFPDWEARMSYQRKQEKFYQSAIKKKVYLLGKRIEKYPEFLTKEELDSIDYFQGTGFYKEHQNLNRKPNIYDTRQTFLLKMHNRVLRDNFLANFNKLNKNND